MLKVAIGPISAAAISLEKYTLHLPLLLTSGSQGLELLPPFLFLITPLLLGLRMLFLRNPDFQVKMRKIAICSMVNNHGRVRNRILPTNPYVHTKFCALESLTVSQPANRDTKLLCQCHSLIQPVGNTQSYLLTQHHFWYGVDCFAYDIFHIQ
jgi:hypothetical protein